MWRLALLLTVVGFGASPFLPDLFRHVETSVQDDRQPTITVAQNTQSAPDVTDAYQRIYRASSDRQGQFSVEARLNGRYVEMLVDTGATHIALPESVADSVGLFVKASDFKYSIRTANGETFAARTVLDRLRIGDIRLTNIDTFVLKDESLFKPLLGMSALRKLERFDISEGTLVLVQ